MMFFGGWMMIVWIVVIVLIAWGVVWMVKYNSSKSDAYQKRSPFEIANERYARGEINKEEYEEIKRNLSR